MAGNGEMQWGKNEKKRGEKLPHLFINVSYDVQVPHFSLSLGDNAATPTP